jgi:hypothetical protein
MPAMHRISLSSFIGLAGFFGFVMGACFIESPQPSTFRFACEADDDCGDTQVCADGLCQQACGAADDLECPNDAPLCFNGHCSSVCPVDEEVCPSPQTCITFEDPSADEPPTSGICGIPCDDQDHPCGEGSLCFEGACVATCMTDDECGEGESCLAGVCIPS